MAKISADEYYLCVGYASQNGKSDNLILGDILACRNFGHVILGATEEGELGTHILQYFWSSTF